MGALAPFAVPEHGIIVVAELAFALCRSATEMKAYVDWPPTSGRVTELAGTLQ
jgi:hypothetical protein